MGIFAVAANAILKSKIGGICRINDFSIGGDEITASVTLEGETSAIDVYASEFRVADDNIYIIKAGSNKPWVNAAIQKYVVGKKFSLPPGASFLI